MTAVASDYMTKQVIALSPSDTIATARNVMLRKRVGRLVVADENDRLVGIISRTDLALALRQGGPAWRRRSIDETLVGDVMITQIKVVNPETSLTQVAKAMRGNDIGGIPVLKDGEIAGIIATHDLTRYVAEEGDTSLDVRDHLNRKVSTSLPLHSINHAIKKMASASSRMIVVLDTDELPVGVITPSNLAFVRFNPSRKSIHSRSEGRRYEIPQNRTTFLGVSQVRDVMSSPVVTIHEKDRVVNAARIMVTHHIGGLPVLDTKPNLVGIFSKREVLEILASRK
jgi:CBS domain-containing protein